jgi:hypothetical protein
MIPIMARFTPIAVPRGLIPNERAIAPPSKAPCIMTNLTGTRFSRRIKIPGSGKIHPAIRRIIPPSRIGG